MIEETPVVDCHLCRDLAFARNLARSMKEGYGRHNSRRDFRHVPTDLLEAIAVARQVSRQRREWLENQQARVIGRIRDHALRERWQDCEIGDAVPEAKFEHGSELNSMLGVNIVVKCIPFPVTEFEGTLLIAEDYQKRTFERVCLRMYCDGDGVLYVWKRIE